MKKIIFATAIVVFCSCKKDPGIPGKNPNNHMEATVTLSSGHVVTINETGENVTFSQGGGYTGGYVITAINSSSQLVSISYEGFSGPDGKGYYETDHGSNIDSSYSSYNTPGDTLVLTVTNGLYNEGHFHYTCILNTLIPDTIIVAGSFKGEFPQ